MNLSTFNRKAIPHVIAIVVFAVLTIFFYSPLFFSNKTLDQNDVNQGIASGMEVKKFREQTGEEALWTNSMFGGMPAYLISTYWSGAVVLNTIEKIISLGFPSSARETFLSMLCFYILLIVFGVRPYLAIAGAITYAFSTYFIVSIEAGHIWKARAIGYSPLVIAGLHLIYGKRKLWLGSALFSLALALEINSNHLQITYYLLFLCVIYVISQLIYCIRHGYVGEFSACSALVIGGVVLGIGANFGKLWATYEYTQYSKRGKSELSSNVESNGGLDRDYAFAWSSGVTESFTLLVPNFYGGASGNYNGKDSQFQQALREHNVPQDQANQYARGYLGYWGPQPGTGGPAYLGALACLLFVLGVILVEPRYKWWLIICTIISILLSWGKNFPLLNYFLFDYLPLYNKFRAVSMTIFMGILTMPLLGFMGLERLIGNNTNNNKRALWIAALTTIFVTLMIALVAYVPNPPTGQLPEWLSGALEASRKSIVRKDSFRTIFFIILSLVTIYFFLNKKIEYWVVGLLLTLISVLDLMGVNTRYLNTEDYVTTRKNTFLTPTPADNRILQDTSSGYRVLNFQTLDEAHTSAFHQSLGGYHGAKMRRYEELMEHRLVPEIKTIAEEGTITKNNSSVISMLNAKYFILGNTADAVVINPYANGRAWFVESIITTNNADEEISELGKIDTKKQAVINTNQFIPEKFEYDSTGTIQLITYAPNKLTFKSVTPVNSYAVFSDIYYPKGWHAYVDGTEKTIQRVDYVLRGLPLPAGEHIVSFEFEPRPYFVGNPIMLVFNIMIALLLFFSLYREYRFKTSV